jgi:preprotein translocase subunit SecG
MKKKYSNTTGGVLARLCLIMVVFFAVLYIKWWFCDREKDIEYKQQLEMLEYHQSQNKEAFFDNEGYLVIRN